MNYNITLLMILCLWNVLTFIVMSIDKYRAVKGRWRISEKALFLCAFLFGGIGIIGGMYILRHKTKHWSFKIFIPIAVISNLTLIYFIFQKVYSWGVC